MARNILTINRYRGVICDSHPEFEGLRYRGICIQCKEDKTNIYRKTPHGLLAVNKRNRAQYSKTPEKSLARYVKRKLDKEKRVPSWANLEAIKLIYIKSKKLGMVVDHIIPLRGRSVSGLHVENNLQLLTQEENDRKGNKYGD